MTIEPGRIINDFIEPNKRQYMIPVYQRNYEWSYEQCVKLFNDIVNASRKDKTHFCGSVVYSQIKEEKGITYYIIIDGQQRITTVYLLIKALIDCAESDKERDAFLRDLCNYDKFDEYAIDQQSKLKLKAVETDNDQLFLLMENKYDKMDKSSGIWINYETFKTLIQQKQKEGLFTKDIYEGIEKLLCAKIKLDDSDNAQEIFERINSTGIPLKLSDKIRNFVLMTDANQEFLYKNYWLEIEKMIDKSQMSGFFQDFLNMKIDGFAKENNAYEIFKQVYEDNEYTNESMLKEMFHYATLYKAFLYGDDKKYNEDTNKYLSGLRRLKQTTIYLFLFKIFDDFEDGIIDETTLNKVLLLFLSYSVRRLVCEVSSNSFRGFYKTLYSRVFYNSENKKKYYDSIVSFLLQLNTKDSIPDAKLFETSLIYNNLYRKNALCKYLLSSIENQGKEKLEMDNLTIEHILPQNDDLSLSWQKMLGTNWREDRDKYLHTLGNLTLTAYNSELGDKPFDEKLGLLDSKNTKVVILYKDVKDCKKWDADKIETRAKNLVPEILKLYPIEEPSEKVSFADKKYKEYKLDNLDEAEHKKPNYYILQGEQIKVESFAKMLISVATRLYYEEPSIIEKLAKENVHFLEGKYAAFSYDRSQVNKDTKIKDTDIYISHNYGSPLLLQMITKLLDYYDIEHDDFIYSACDNAMKKEKK